MDHLDRVLVAAADLLQRVEGVLASAGAPADHPIWPVLREVRVLPGSAVRAVAGLRVAPVAGAGAALRRQVGALEAAAVGLAGDGSWQGAAADGYTARRVALREHLTTGPRSVAHGVRRTADYADALVDWIEESRLALARTLADVLGSAQAAALPPAPTHGQPAEHLPTSARAAADIGARVLETVARCCRRGDELARRWAPELSGWPAGQRPDDSGQTGAVPGAIRVDR